MAFASLLLVVLAAFIHAGWNLLAKRAASVGPVFVFAYTFVGCIAYAPWVFYLLVQGDGIAWTWRGIGFILLSGLIHLAYSLFLQRGYQVADLSVVYPVARGTGPMLSTFGAFLILGELPSARGLIGLVPQELTIDAFETVWATVNYSRGLFGKPANKAFVEKVLRDLSLWEKKDAKAITLSGGMKRRLMIAKALSHEPRVLFLDEPTAGVDVELRQDMWEMVRRLREDGVTIILTTHYIEEAEAMADRVGVINKGEIILVEGKAELMRKLGRKQMTLELRAPLGAVPEALSRYALELSADGGQLTYTYDNQSDRPGVASLLRDLGAAGIEFRDLDTQNSSLEEIFVNLLRQDQ